MWSEEAISPALILTLRTINACLKVWSVDSHRSYQLAKLAAASGESKLRVRIVALAVERIAIAVVDDLAGQARFAC